MTLRYYHNPRCSKSRQGLLLLHERGIEPEVIKYLETSLHADTVQRLLEKLDDAPERLIRTNEEAFLPYRDESLTAARVAELIAAHPKLLQRPVLETETQVVVGRPPERLLDVADA